MAFTVITTDNANQAVRVEHREADTIDVEDGHLVLRARRLVVGIYAPERWHSVVEERRAGSLRGSLSNAMHEVSA